MIGLSLSSSHSCLLGPECLSSSSLNATLWATEEWDILRCDPWGSQVVGNRRRDERDSNYGETKTTLSPNNCFWWEKNETGEFNIKTFLPNSSLLVFSHGRLRPDSDLTGAGSYLMVIGQGTRTQEVTVWFPQCLPVRTGNCVELWSTVHTPTTVWRTQSLCFRVSLRVSALPHACVLMSGGRELSAPTSVCFFVVL